MKMNPTRNKRPVTGMMPYIQRNLTKWLSMLLLVVVAILTLMPFVWVVATSLRTPADSFTLPPKWIPTDMDFSNYSMVFEKFHSGSRWATASS
jgi:ABC-type glycerol-3-phosphate transport system permease component